MKKILAKSSGLSLIDHSKLVSRFAIEIANQSLLTKDDELIEIIRLSALLHDIGKCTTQFQKKLGVKGIEEAEIECKIKYRHNEVGWAFLSRYLNVKNLDIILDNVYWHHGISNRLSGYYDTDIEITDTDITTMNEYLISIGLVGVEKEYKPKKSPRYYISGDNADEVNSKNLFTRTCLISADRLASSLNDINISDEEIMSYVSASNTRCCDVDITSHKYYGNKRFLQQEDIISKVVRTTQINAPAGFGKTLLGLLWNFKTNRKLIWVCPRNVVAESVYKSILEELNNFGVNYLSVELYTGGEVKECNELFNGDFSSDIIVTNIDNYLSPSVDNRHGERLYTIINSDVVFDEFHELVSDSALFSCFINIMKTRNCLTNSSTLLLSATATHMHRLWDSVNQKTLLLPEKGRHYLAPHTNKYLIRTGSNINITNKYDNNLIVLNSIGNAQMYKKPVNADLLIHSKFEDLDRDNNMKLLYDFYGKNSIRNQVKPNIVGTHIIQASLDVSFNNLYESVLSPQSTLQRCGRCDRWGDIVTESSINIIRLVNNGETSVRNLLYTNNLSNLWFEHISKYDNQKLTLDELYLIYNEFESNYENILYRYVYDKYVNSLESLSYIYPVKFFTKGKSDIKSAGGNKLRSTNSEVFVICKYYNSDKYTNPYSISVRENDFNKEFNENESSNILKRILGTMKLLRDSNDDRFDYNEILTEKKYMNLDNIRKFGKKSNTPYIRFDKVYHPEYGEISPNKLNILL
jgi:CRISPR-associated endonuclease Cas3-HD